MAETLGTLCDKLTIVKLKRHTEDPDRRQLLEKQEQQLQVEMTEFVAAATEGGTPIERLTFAANKVYKKEGNTLSDIRGTVGEIFSLLAAVN
jgi:hypothetical protein